MALKNHKKTITRIFILLVVMTLICMGVFACTNYLEQQSKAFVDMSKVQLIQLDEPESDAPAMKITTTAGTIVAELFPEQAPAYVKQFTELAESGYYDDTYVFSDITARALGPSFNTFRAANRPRKKQITVATMPVFREIQKGLQSKLFAISMICCTEKPPSNSTCCLSFNLSQNRTVCKIEKKTGAGTPTGNACPGCIHYLFTMKQYSS